MSLFRQYPWFSAAWLLLGLVLAAEIGGIVERRSALRRIEAQLDRKRRDVKKLISLNPVPTPENATVIEADRLRLEEILAATEAELRGDRPAADRGRKPAPVAKPADVFFELAAFVEKAREQAASLGIGLRPEERFGFSAYANEGPEAEFIPAVQRQQRVVAYLTAALFTARPNRLLAVERETPTGVAGGPPSLGGSRERDLFEIETARSVRRPGLIEADAFRLVFVGYTASLRTFLTKLAGFELPIIVRGIEVEPATTTDARSVEGRNGPAESAAMADRSLRPLVIPLLSKFTVTVELVGLVAAKPGP